MEERANPNSGSPKAEGLQSSSKNEYRAQLYRCLFIVVAEEATCTWIPAPWREELFQGRPEPLPGGHGFSCAFLSSIILCFCFIRHVRALPWKPRSPSEKERRCMSSASHEPVFHKCGMWFQSPFPGFRALALCAAPHSHLSW